MLCTRVLHDSGAMQCTSPAEYMADVGGVVWVPLCGVHAALLGGEARLVPIEAVEPGEA